MQALAALTPAGPLVEVGVYQGGTASYLYELALDQDRQLWLYDTFTGMPFAGHDDGNPVGSFADGPPAAEIAAYFPIATVVPGVFPTVQKFPKHVAFVHADGDQYQTTKDILDVFGPRMIKDGVILFDDYDITGCDGCTRAVDERFKSKDLGYAEWMKDWIPGVTFSGRLYLRKR